METGPATVAFTRYLTPTGSITPSLQLFTSAWDGAGWAAPVPRSDDSLGQRSPQVLYNSANQPLLIWLAGRELRLLNLATDSSASLPLPAEITSIDELRAVQDGAVPDGAGDLAAVFTAQSALGPAARPLRRVPRPGPRAVGRAGGADGRPRRGKLPGAGARRRGPAADGLRRHGPEHCDAHGDRAPPAQPSPTPCPSPAAPTW